ncbi:MAG: amidohydrolase [Candidatus Didemnitutus sp.]|nr:amidohydrolase [Candidatus Didemnitutus sp.]
MPNVDAHVHLYPPEVAADPEAWAAARGETHWARLCTRRRQNGAPVQLFPSVDELLRDMDAARIDRSVLLGWYWEKPATCAAQNRFYERCVRAHPDRLAACAAVHPDDLAELRRARDAGFCGVGELSPHSQGLASDDPRVTELLQCAGELKLPVNLHVTDPASRRYDGWVATPLDDFARWARELPETRFVLAHWGGGMAFDPASRALANVWFDTAASPLLYDATAWQRAVTAVGAERLLFGSDYPLRLFPRDDAGSGLARFAGEARANLSREAWAAVMGGNATSLFGAAR